MADYTYAQLKTLWIQNGGNLAVADIAAAIAMAESGGKSDASNINSDGSVDRGLWEINSSHGSLSTFDPIANVKAAIQLSGNGKNWSPWTTFKTGAYKKYLSPTTGAANSLPADTTAGIGIPGIGGGISVSGLVDSAVNALLKMLGLGSLKDMVERAGLIILGFALVILGIKILSSGSGSGQPININTTTEEGETGTKTSRSIKTPVSHTQTTTSRRAAAGTGTSEAVEAAAVA